MPPSALEQLTRLNIIYPMLFKLTNKKTNRITHCGVLEFVADEGKVYLPYWVNNNYEFIINHWKVLLTIYKTINLLIWRIILYGIMLCVYHDVIADDA